jgi:hypothetical protein
VSKARSKDRRRYEEVVKECGAERNAEEVLQVGEPVDVDEYEPVRLS